MENNNLLISNPFMNINGFEIFGIKLNIDDIILIGLLFILYTEGVKDEMLYIALILLLIT